MFNAVASLIIFYAVLSVFLSRGPNWVATLNAGKGGAHASYYHRANKQVVSTATTVPPVEIHLKSALKC